MSIGAFGPQVNADTRTQIARKVDSLFAQIGGFDAAKQIFRILRKTQKLHAEIWLLGNVLPPPSADQTPQPAVPFGWLLSIALRNIHVSPCTTDSAKLWNSAVGLAIDFAASTDCQYYNKFEGMHLEATDFLPTLIESLEWRELFTFAQVPTAVLPILRQSFSQIDWPNDTDDLRRDVDRLFGELDWLLSALRKDRLSMISRANVRFPLLWTHARASKGQVNSDYLDPFGKGRDHERYVFFEASAGKVVALPSSLTAAAGCEAIFRLIWARTEQSSASGIVSDTIEKAVSLACRGHTANVWEKVIYQADSVNLEIDIAARDEQEIILFECKAKSLTEKARTRDIMAFIDDYTKSFLSLLGQLVRHDQNIKCGLTPLTQDGENPHALRITKIAVSPLSYGPVSHHVLVKSLMHSMAQIRLRAVQEDPRHHEILKDFNESVHKTNRIIEHLAPRRDDGSVNIFGYLLGVLWLDLGQLIYVLFRGCSLTNALSALSHITFSTRDFWTDAALADRQGFTKDKWKPLQ